MKSTQSRPWYVRVGLFFGVLAVGLFLTWCAVAVTGLFLMSAGREASRGTASYLDMVAKGVAAIGMVISAGYAWRFLREGPPDGTVVDDFRCPEPGCNAPVKRLGAVMGRKSYQCTDGHSFLR